MKCALSHLLNCCQLTLALSEVHRVDLIADDLFQVHNVLVIQLPQNLDLSDGSDGEPLLLLLIVRSHHLQRHQVTGQGVPSLVDLSGREERKGRVRGRQSELFVGVSLCHMFLLQSGQ